MSKNLNDYLISFISHPSFSIILIIIIVFNGMKIIKDISNQKNNKKKITESLINMENVNAKKNALQSSSSNYSNQLKGRLTVAIDDMALNTYGNNYMKIIDDMEHFFNLKMLENVLVIDYDDDEQMIKRVNKIGKIQNAKNSLTDVRSLVQNFVK
jgi:hypothetical protein